MKHEILLVEDDRSLAKNLQQTFETHFPCNCTIAWNLQVADCLLADKDYDLLILDRALPDGDSLDFLPAWIKANFAMRVLILSCISDAQQRELGLRSGASDYLAKPFTRGELLERTRKLLSVRKTNHFCQQFSLKNQQEEMIFLPSERKLSHKNKTINLTKADSELLEYFCIHRNFLITREEIERCLWQGNREELNQSAINAQIYRLRKKMGQFGHLLQTFYNFGYQLTTIK